MTTRQELLDFFRRNSVLTVTINYSGSDDSGFFDNLEAHPPAVNLDAILGTKPHPWTKGAVITHTVRDAVSSVFFDIVETKHPGWENDSGACGELFWDIATDNITLDHHEYLITTEDYHYEI